MKHNVYLFSGLGADERIFTRLKLPRSQIRHIKWPKVTKDTSAVLFLAAIKSQIVTKNNNVLLGVSFGGLIAQDIAAAIRTETLIVVSSATDQEEIPRLYRGVLASLALGLTPNIFLNKPNFLINYMFSVQTKEGRSVLSDVISDSDPGFVRWAIAYIRQWQKPNLSAVNHIHRIHGTRDRIFPNVKSKSNTEFVQGGHFAVYEAADEINGCLKPWL